MRRRLNVVFIVSGRFSPLPVLELSILGFLIQAAYSGAM
jgi:hypothetical protein